MVELRNFSYSYKLRAIPSEKCVKGLFFPCPITEVVPVVLVIKSDTN